MTAIQVENLSKAYQLGQIGTGTISRDLERFFVTKVLGKEDPFLKIGQTNDRTTKGSSDIVWSLKDINFSIEQGDAVGIIGRNGAGKSTLLKLLSRVTSPTTGSIKVKGRVASLLEVGTGFHPELSGRENIFLNGAILGMRKAEIKRKFDEIVDFSGVERYIDTPVKRYSSGMYVRLAFAVAAHLESEILIVDEVLAVGDAEFQKKCLGKMGDISKGEGRTVLFVSHNMASIKMLCKNSILLSNGLLINTDKTDLIINEYKNLIHNAHTNTIFEFENEYIKFVSIAYRNENNEEFIAINTDIYLSFEIDFKVDLTGVAFEMFVKNNQDLNIFTSITNTISINRGSNKIECIIPKNLLNNETYLISFGISKNYNVFLAKFENVLKLDVENYIETYGWQGAYEGVVRPRLQWIINNKNII